MFSLPFLTDTAHVGCQLQNLASTQLHWGALKHTRSSQCIENKLSTGNKDFGLATITTGILEIPIISHFTPNPNIEYRI